VLPITQQDGFRCTGRELLGAKIETNLRDIDEAIRSLKS